MKSAAEKHSLSFVKATPLSRTSLLLLSHKTSGKDLPALNKWLLELFFKGTELLTPRKNSKGYLPLVCFNRPINEYACGSQPLKLLGGGDT